MNQAHFYFHGDINFFLPSDRREKRFAYAFNWRGSVKDMIESLGVPHPEIGLIVVNGAAVDFSYIVMPDDQIDVYAETEDSDINPKAALRPPLPERPTFILDQHLGRLAAYLRMMGFDTLYRNDYHDEELAQVSHDEGRVLLTRDIGLLKRSAVIYGYFVRETNPERQIAEITRRYRLATKAIPFKHCTICNGLLHPVPKATIADQLPSGTAQFYDEFHRCDSCEQVYWKGSHHQRIQALMDSLL